MKLNLGQDSAARMNEGFGSLSFKERLMFGLDFEVDAWLRF